MQTLKFTPWTRVSLWIHLACSFHPSFCMLLLNSCLQPCSDHAQSIRFVCTCCVHYKSISHIHTWSHSLLQNCHHGRSMINHKCHAFHSHRRLVMLSMCFWMVWIISLASRVAVCLKDHICIFHSFKQLAILLKFRRPDSPLPTRPSPQHWLDRLSPRIVQTHQESHFKLHFPHAYQLAFKLVDQRIWPGSHLEAHSPQNLCRGYRPFLLH